MKQELLISPQSIRNRVKALAAQISSDYSGKEPILVGILNGAVFFLSDLARELTIPVKIDFMRAASYGSQMTSSGTIRITKDVEISVSGKPVLLIEDIVDTGSTLTCIIENIKNKGAESVEVCALIDKLERRTKAVPIHYCGFEIEEGFLVGYGLDYDERFRHLPGIYVLKEVGVPHQIGEYHDHRM